MLHRHDFDHVQIWLLGSPVDSKDGIDNIRCELLSKGAVQFRGKRGASDGQQQLTIRSPRQLELVEKLYKYLD